ncbi:MAG TPA: hypothetical protein VHB73_05550, partial [Alphaproteobacteria bacterium]|nr:hypothetical protein [Alphaproteobacteria bacterium]
MQQTIDDIANRLYNLALEAKDNELLTRHYYETFKLELAIADIFGEFTQGRPLPMRPELSEAYSFIVMFYQAYQNLSEPGRQRFKEELRKSYKHPYGLRPLAFEFTVATHFFK